MVVVVPGRNGNEQTGPNAPSHHLPSRRAQLHCSTCNAAVKLETGRRTTKRVAYSRLVYRYSAEEAVSCVVSVLDDTELLDHRGSLTAAVNCVKISKTNRTTKRKERVGFSFDLSTAQSIQYKYIG